MNDHNTQALDAEKELAEAIGKIQESVADLEKLKNASETLKDVGKKNTELADQLLEAARQMHKGSKYLSEEGVKAFGDQLARFEERLEQAKDEITQSITSTGSHIRGELDKGTRSLKIIVIVFGIATLGLLTYIGFFK